MAHRGSTEIFIPVQKYLFQYKNIYPSTKIFIPVQKYLSQYKNIFPSTKIFIPVQKYFSQYKNIFPVQIENGIYFPRGHCELHWSTCEYGSSFRGLGRRGGLTVSTLDSGASAPGSSRGWGHCVVFSGKTLNSHSASLYPGVSMGTDKLLRKPNKLLGSHLRWTSTPSRRGRNTPTASCYGATWLGRLTFSRLVFAIAVASKSWIQLTGIAQNVAQRFSV